MDELVHRMPWGSPEERPAALLSREWLVTNGLGGYASGSISGALTRRFHGLLVAALPVPLGRVLMLAHMSEEVRLPDGRTFALGAEERPGVGVELHGERLLTEFRLERGLPVWRFELGSVVLEKRVVLPHLQNTVHVTYELLKADGPVRLRLRPSVHLRPHEGRVDAPIGDEDYHVVGYGRRFEVCGPADLPPLRLLVHGERSAFVLDGGRLRDYFYRVEAARGYDARGPLWSPGYMRADLDEGGSATLVASTEPWATIQALSPRVAREAEHERRRRLLEAAGPRVHGDAIASQLVLAADQFIITPATRVADAARAHASGDDVRTVIAGYPWFTDWGRDTMISLEGLCLATGRHAEAGWILRTFGHYVKDGLIPNLFPEHDTEGLYHTADATLWFFHAVNRYVSASGDERTLAALLPILGQIVEAHLRGTRFGIAVDPVDGLLRQGQEGYQLTWMDAKVDGWVVTPRRGKAVEINALWYNALRLLEGWLRAAGADADAIAGHADRCRASFNERFWCERAGHLYDVIDGEAGHDAALRPNQLLAFSLDHPVLDQARWGPVLEVCRRDLLTPVGLRSLAPAHADYKARYDGDLRSRDAAYHQGTVWGWLVGPYVDAHLRVHPGDVRGAREALEGMGQHLGDACLGTISEIFDAEAPYHARGCVAQAWSVAEVLRCWLATAEP